LREAVKDHIQHYERIILEGILDMMQVILQGEATTRITFRNVTSCRISAISRTMAARSCRKNSCALKARSEEFRFQIKYAVCQESCNLAPISRSEQHARNNSSKPLLTAAMRPTGMSKW
jgi:hypothetical protein